MIPITPNRKAFLEMIGYSEGTNKVPDSDDGYRVLYGGGTFKSYLDHPRQRITINGLTSTAAGKFQVLSRIYDAYKKQLGLKDFSPYSQNQIALQLISERHALADIDCGDVNGAVFKCAKAWASFPSAGYGQHEQRLTDLRQAYLKAGGTIKDKTNG